MGEGKIIILGGYGHTGQLLAELLLAETEVDLVLAGRNKGKAAALATELNARFGRQRACGAYADAADPTSLAQAFAGVDMVVVASSTADYTANVATAVLKAGIDYLDVQYSTRKLALLQSMTREIAGAGRCFITDGGFHPGLPAVLIRYLAPQFDSLESARVGSIIKIDWASLDLSPSTMEEFVGEFIAQGRSARRQTRPG